MSIVVVKYGWPMYLTPTVLVKDEIEKYKHKFENEWRYNGEDKLSWTTALALAASNYNNNTYDCNIRNVYKITRLETIVTNINMVEGFLLTIGLNIDEDTDIPTLPGSVKLAKEMLLVRAELLDPNATEKDILEFVAPTIEICKCIVEDPHNQHKYRDEAPLNVLRQGYMVKE